MISVLSTALSTRLANSSSGLLALLVAMDFVIATIVTMLPHFALIFLSRPFGMPGVAAYDVIQAIIVAVWFWPIVVSAKQLKTMVTSAESKRLPTA